MAPITTGKGIQSLSESLFLWGDNRGTEGYMLLPPPRLFEDLVSFYNTASVYEKTKRAIRGGVFSTPIPRFSDGVCVLIVTYA